MSARTRDEALDLFLATRAELIAQCREAMIALWKERRADVRGVFDNDEWIAVPHPTVSGDDASEWLDRQRTTYDPRLLGAVFRPNSGWIGRGWAPSRLPRRHGRPVKQWEWGGA